MSMKRSFDFNSRRHFHQPLDCSDFCGHTHTVHTQYSHCTHTHTVHTHSTHTVHKYTHTQYTHTHTQYTHTHTQYSHSTQIHTHSTHTHSTHTHTVHTHERAAQVQSADVNDFSLKLGEKGCGAPEGAGPGPGDHAPTRAAPHRGSWDWPRDGRDRPAPRPHHRADPQVSYRHVLYLFCHHYCFIGTNINKCPLLGIDKVLSIEQK